MFFYHVLVQYVLTSNTVNIHLFVWIMFCYFLIFFLNFNLWDPYHRLSWRYRKQLRETLLTIATLLEEENACVVVSRWGPTLARWCIPTQSARTSPARWWHGAPSERSGLLELHGEPLCNALDLQPFSEIDWSEEKQIRLIIGLGLPIMPTDQSYENPSSSHKHSRSIGSGPHARILSCPSLTIITMLFAHCSLHGPRWPSRSSAPCSHVP